VDDVSVVDFASSNTEDHAWQCRSDRRPLQRQFATTDP